ncbi:MAG: DMT family transporter [Proteobacteria bacterium]|nr:DMT family transporter [Pseudomonadota bacterium]
MNLALAAAALTGVQVGAAIVASRLVVGEVPPLTLALLRYAIGLACLLPFAAWALLRRGSRPAARAMAPDLLPMALLGVVQFAAVIALLNYGLRHVGAAQAALIFSLFPLLTLALSAALGQDRITPALLGGMLLSVAGVGLALAPRLAASQGGHWWGELAMLASTVLGAGCSVLYRPYLRRHPALPVSAWAMAASVAALAVLALTEGWPARLPLLSSQAWGVAAFIGLSSGVGYFLWLYALKHESPARVTVFLALNPVTAAVLGALVLGEPLALPVAGAIVLIAGGLALAVRTAKPVDGHLKA